MTEQRTNRLTPQERSAIAMAAAQTHSWFYWPAWTRRMRFFIIAAALLAAAVGYLTAAGVNPELWPHLGRNTISHLTDPRLGHDYPAAGLTSMVLSGNHLAIGTERDGLVLLPTRGTVPRGVLPGAAILDTAAGPQPDSFLALGRTQDLVEVRAQPWTVTTRTLMSGAGPLQWPGIKLFPLDAVRLARLDRQGLLLAVRDRGLARYVMDEKGEQRVRRWQAAKLEAAPGLQDAWLAGEGIWTYHQDGKLRHTAYAGLTEIPAHARQVGPLRHFAAGRDGAWAAAVAQSGAVSWFEQDTWSGEFFAAPPASADPHAAQVKSARLSHGLLWLATGAGVRAWDESTHSIRVFVPDVADAEIESAPVGTLLATPTGLYLQPVTSTGPQDLKRLDERSSSALSLSGSGDTAVFATRAKDTDRLFQVAPAPFSAARALAADHHWPGAAPRIVGVVPYGSRALLATSRGCLWYDVDRAIYDDCSVLAVPKDQPPRHTGGFSELLVDPTGIFGVAQGRPLRFDTAAGTWQELAPAGRLDLRSLSVASEHIFGLDQDGSLLEFRSETVPPGSYIEGRASAPGSWGDGVTGDLTGAAESWQAAWVVGGKVYHYVSDRGRLSEQDASGEDIAQVRLDGDAPLLRRADGAIRHAGAPQLLFGSGALPFDPAEARLIAPGRDDTLIVTGPQGAVARYDWRNGTWVMLPALPDDTPATRIKEQGGTLLALAADRVLCSTTDGWWKQLDDYATWLHDPDKGQWILAGRAGIGVITASAGCALSTPPYSSGSGIKSFAATADYLWQPDPDRVVLFAGARIGVFDRRTDRWEMPEPLGPSPSRLVPAGDALIAVSPGSLTLLTPDMKRAALLEGRDIRGLYVGHRHIRAILHDSQGFQLAEWNDLSEKDPHLRPLGADLSDAALAADGSVWGIVAGKLCRLWWLRDWVFRIPWFVDLPPGTSSFSQVLGSADPGYAFLAPQTAPRDSRASLTYGRERLDWRSQGTGVEVGWRGRADLAVWCSDRDLLAIQCIRGVQLRNGEILVSTQGLTLRRNVANYQLQGVLPSEPPPVSEAVPGVVGSGLLRFQLGDRALIAQDAAGEEVPWVRTDSGWHLPSDRADWIGRTRSAGLVLSTGHGTWTWSPTDGRNRGGAAPAEPEASAVTTPALHAAYSDGHLNGTAFDGRDLFVQGRFFFDTITSLAGTADALYGLAGERALIRRDPNHPSRITGAWALPDAGPGRLSPGTQGPRFVSHAGTWAFDPKRDSNPWTPLTPEAALVVAETGFIRWQRPDPLVDEIVPYADATPVPAWWSNDRFTWDRINAACALDGGRVVTVTPVGTLVKQLARNGFRAEAWRSHGAPADCRTARREGRVVGVRIEPTGAGNGTRLLVDLDSAGKPEFRPAPEGPWDLSPRLILDWFQDSQRGRRIGWRQVWSQEVGAPPLESRVDALPTPGLMAAGRFAFDQVQAVGRVAPQLWAAVVGCADARCLAALYQPVGGNLWLRDLVPLDAEVSILMPDSNGVLYGRTAAESATITALRASDKVLDVRQVDRAAVGDAFRVGDKVTFFPPDLKWDSVPRSLDTAPPILEVLGDDYPLLTEYDGGVAFSFDLLRAVALIPGQDRLAIATDGGLLHCRYPEGTFDPSSRGDCRLHYRDQGVSLLGLKHIENANGALWVLSGEDRTFRYDGARLISEADAVPSRQVCTMAGPLIARESGVEVAGRLFTSSNEPLGIGSHSLGHVVDLLYEPESKYAWLRSDRHAFKLRLSALAKTLPENHTLCLPAREERVQEPETPESDTELTQEPVAPKNNGESAPQPRACDQPRLYVFRGISGRPDIELQRYRVEADCALKENRLPEDSIELIELVQYRLKYRGFSPGRLDGLLGPHTADAIRRFENARGLTNDRTITYALLDTLQED